MRALRFDDGAVKDAGPDLRDMLQRVGDLRDERLLAVARERRGGDPDSVKLLGGETGHGGFLGCVAGFGVVQATALLRIANTLPVKAATAQHDDHESAKA